MNPAADRWNLWKEAWAPTFPSECSDCDESVANLLTYYREKLLGQGRIGLMSYDQDTIIATFFGLLPGQFKSRLMDLCAILDEEPEAQYFVLSGLLHTMTIVGDSTMESGDGTPLWKWIKQMVEDDPNWTSYKP